MHGDASGNDYVQVLSMATATVRVKPGSVWPVRSSPGPCLQVLPLFYLEGAWLMMEFPSAGSARSGPDFSEHRHSLSCSTISTGYNSKPTRRVRAMDRQRSKCWACVGIRPNRGAVTCPVSSDQF
jgi:hypothetical protein